MKVPDRAPTFRGQGAIGAGHTIFQDDREPKRRDAAQGPVPPLLGHDVFVFTLWIAYPLVGFDLEPNVAAVQVALITRDLRPEDESRVPQIIRLTDAVYDPGVV